MKKLEKITQMVMLAIIVVALAACSKEDEINDQPDNTGIVTATVKIKKFVQSTDVANSLVKTAFEPGDVLHIGIMFNFTDIDEYDVECYTLTLGNNNIWLFDRPFELPKDNTELIRVISFYDGNRASYTNEDAFTAAMNQAENGITTGTPPITTFTDILNASANIYMGEMNDYDGLSISDDGKMDISMRHGHALMRIASITNNMGSPVKSIQANLTHFSLSGEYSYMTTPLSLIHADGNTGPVAEVIAGNRNIINSFDVTLENGETHTVHLPEEEMSEDANGNPLGIYLNSHYCITFDLVLNPGNLTAKLVDNK